MFRYIRAMAYDKKSVQNSLIDRAAPLTEHLIKLYLYTGSQYENHWRKDVWGFLNSVPKLRSTKKFPTKDFIYASISGYADMVSNFVESISAECRSLEATRSDLVELESILLEYFDWISEKLSAKGLVTPSDIYIELDQLGL